MPDQKRHEDQQREHRMPGQDRGQQNTGNRDRESPQGARFDQDRPNRDRPNQEKGNQGKQDMNDQSRR
ncbi:MAG TPA: hypothetical protein VGQ37_25535 [Vicinamibacterales bacterium]|nr:hypothetical protein [Vicinamibacterales bacterium]